MNIANIKAYLLNKQQIIKVAWQFNNFASMTVRLTQMFYVFKCPNVQISCRPNLRVDNKLPPLQHYV